MVRGVSVALDSNDTYMIEFLYGQHVVKRTTVHPVPSFGMRRVEVQFAPISVDSVRIGASGGDRSFSMGQLELR